MRIIGIIVGVLCAITAFSSFQKIETEFFNILFEPGLEAQAEILYREGPEIYRRLTDFYRIFPSKKLNVYLQDCNDYGNAYADFFSHAIIIYVNRASASYINNTYRLWVPFVFSHELTHILIANKPFWFKNFLNLFGRPVSMFFDTAFSPSYLHEGLSIYSESMFYGEGRFFDTQFDMYLRRDVYENRFYGFRLGGGVSSTAFNPVGMNYLYGASFFEFLGERYGAKVVSSLLTAMGNQWMSLKRALETTTMRSYSYLLSEWEDWCQENAYALLPSTGADAHENLTGTGFYTGRPVSSGQYLYYLSQSEKSSGIVRRATNGSEEWWEVPYPTSYDVSPSGRLAFVYGIGDGLEFYTRYLYLGDWGTALWKSPLIDRVNVIRWLDDRLLLAITTENGGTALWLADTETGRKQRLIPGSPHFYLNSLCAISDQPGEPYEVVCSITYDGQARLYRMELMMDEETGTYGLGSWEIVGSPKGNSLDPVYADGALYYANNLSGIYNLYRWEMESGLIQQLTNIETGAFQPALFDGQIYYSRYATDGFDLFRAPVSEDSVTLSLEGSTTFAPIPTRYEALRLETNPAQAVRSIPQAETVFLLPKPRIWLPIAAPAPGGFGVFGGVVGWDDLKRWIWAFNGFYLSESELSNGLNLPLWNVGVDLVHRGLIPFSASVYLSSEELKARVGLDKSFVNRINQDLIRMQPSIGVQWIQSDVSQWALQWEYYQDIGVIGNPANSVSVPKYFSLFTNTPGMGFRTGFGFKLPFAAVGMANISVREETVFAGFEGWAPIPIAPFGTANGKYRLNSLAFHTGAYLTNDPALFQLIAGIQVDFGFQYWVNMKIGIDLVLQKDKISPKFSLNFTDISFGCNSEAYEKPLTFTSLLP